MKRAIGLFVVALCASMTAAAQVELPGCGCRVSASSAVGCSCASGMQIKKADGSTSKQSTAGDHSGPILDKIVLSPGALLTRWVPGEDELIIGQGVGELTNEAKSPSLPIAMSAGVVLFMPRDEPYELRNAGKEDVVVLVIRIHPTCAASQ